MAAIENEKVFGLKLRESADDGSDFGTPDADYRFLFLGEDGQLHAKDSADAVTTMGSGIAATLLDAKGDLIGASAADTAARLAVGANGYLLVADSSQTTGLRWMPRVTCRKTTNETFNSTSYANSTNMGLALLANTNYLYRFVVFYNTNATSVGIKLAIQGPASCLAYASIQAGISAGSIVGAATMVAAVTASADISTDLAVLQPATGPGGQSTVAVIYGTIINGANAGTLQLRHASETATDTTILENSHGELVALS